jgi:SAM-dependent methyltransferase
MALRHGMVMKGLRALLGQVPALSNTYHQARLLLHIFHEGWWTDPQRVMDQNHLQRVWNFADPVEQERYQSVLRALRGALDTDKWGAALEVGCSEGLFTSELAKYCRSVTAWDVSSVACERAVEHCAPHANVRVEHRDLSRDDFQERYDLIFVMDSLDYLHGRKRVLCAINKLVDALRGGGFFVYCACRLPEGMRTTRWARWLGEGADSRVEMLTRTPGLKLVTQGAYPLAGQSIPGYVDHMIALFQKTCSEEVGQMSGDRT